MIEQSANYVFQTPEGGWRIVGTRVSLDSVIHAYWDGHAPEQILSQFPSLTLEKIHGVITFYLHNQEELDQHLKAQAAQWERVQTQSETRNADLLHRLRNSASGSAT